MGRRDEGKSGDPAAPPAVYWCHFCGERFPLPREEPLPIRFVGREPKVQCPDCKKSETLSGP